jgi:hypothetical protein
VKRKLALGVLAVLLALVVNVAVCGGLVVAIRDAQARCPDRHRIKTGMTQDEVRAILGEPAGTRQLPVGDGDWLDDMGWQYECEFLSLTPDFVVMFDKNGRVVGTLIRK